MVLHNSRKNERKQSKIMHRSILYFCLMVTLGLSKMVKTVQNSLIKILKSACEDALTGR